MAKSIEEAGGQIIALALIHLTLSHIPHDQLRILIVEQRYYSGADKGVKHL